MAGTYPILIKLRRKVGEGMEKRLISLLESHMRSVLTAKTGLLFPLRDNLLIQPIVQVLVVCTKDGHIKL